MNRISIRARIPGDLNAHKNLSTTGLQHGARELSRGTGTNTRQLQSKGHAFRSATASEIIPFKYGKSSIAGYSLWCLVLLTYH